MAATPVGYDFIVVGAGTAGCVIAARLSEDGAARVLLLEAGGATPPEAAPAAWPGLLDGPADWADRTIVQSAIGKSVAWPRGRTLGGSSSINAMNFVRGHRACYDAWESGGATGWNFDALLPYFKRSEHAEGRDPSLRGRGGPLRPRPAQPGHPIARAGLEAAAQAGFPLADDISAGVEEGFGWCDLNIVDGRRQSAADAYLAPAVGRSNLDVVTDALVHRLTISADRCTGVEYSVGGKLVTAACTSQVVLTAGAVGSPLVLLRSGIGPCEHVRAHGIPVIADLPGVGSNLHDHPMSGIVYRSARPVPHGTNNHGEVQGLIDTGIGGHGPDVQIMFVDVPLRAEALAGPEMDQGYTIAVSLMAPFSRGSVRLSRNAPAAPPLIDPRYYTDDRDLRMMVAGLRVARQIGAAPALAAWCQAEALPGPAVRDPLALRGYLRENIRSYSHYGGTCRIGADEAAVVDAELRVLGISGLRIADASVMPSPVSGNTNAAVYAIAERAAEIMRSRPVPAPDERSARQPPSQSGPQTPAT